MVRQPVGSGYGCCGCRLPDSLRCKSDWDPCNIFERSLIQEDNQEKEGTARSVHSGEGDSFSEMDAGNARSCSSDFHLRVEEEGCRDHARAMDALYRWDTRKMMAEMV